MGSCRARAAAAAIVPQPLPRCKADFPGLRRPGLRYIPLADQQPLSFGAAWLGGGQSQVLRRFLTLLEETIRLPQEAPASAP